MKVLVIGAAGFLGKHLVRDFSKDYEVFGADKYEKVDGLYYLDLVKKGIVKEIFARVKPQIVLLPASITGVDFCEQNQDLAWEVNTEGVKETAVCARKEGAFLVFYSSDYVFDGSAGPYSEDDRTNPINFYGKTKLEAEKIVQKELKRFLIIRTCSLYGYEEGGLNFAMQITGALKDKKVVRAARDQFGTPTYVEDMSAVTLKLLKGGKEGIFNVVGPDYVNRVQFANKIADIFNLDAGLIEEVDTAQLKQAAPRPKKGGLKTDKLRLEAGINSIGLEEGLSMMKNKMTKEMRGL